MRPTDSRRSPSRATIVLTIALCVMFTLNMLGFIRSATLIVTYLNTPDAPEGRLPILIGLASLPVINLIGVVLLGMGRRIGYALLVITLGISFGLTLMVNQPIEGLALTILGLAVLWFILQDRWPDMKWV